MIAHASEPSCDRARAVSAPPDRPTARRRRQSAHARRSALLLTLALVATTVAGCTTKQPDTPEVAPASMQLLAVLPVESASAAAGDAAGGPVPSDAGMVVTAQLYRALAEQTEFRVVPDLTVADVLETPDLRHAASLQARAAALGKEVGADGVIFGRVLRFHKRVGTDFGASEPASVWFELGLVSVASGEVVWTGHFDQTQEPLSFNLFKWWMFWEAGPRWMSAAELTGLGVDRLFADMAASINTES